MSPFKILVISAAGLAVAGVATVLTVGYVNSPTQPEAAKAPTPAPAAPPALSAAEVKVAYDECVQKMFPTTADAGQRSAACSKALGSRQLQPTEVAMARLTRGVARTMLGDKVLASEDYLDAIRHYDQLINAANPDALNLFRRAAALDAVGQTDKALTDYSDAIKLDPNASLAFLNRGVLLATRKRAYAESAAIYLDERPYIYLWHPVLITGTQANIEGLQMVPDGLIRPQGLKRTP